MGFLGFLGCITALTYVYAHLIEPKTLSYLPFYKLSQDHLELLFYNIRAHGGMNNNLTARQFISAYNKILTRVSIRDTNHGNCAALECIAILNSTSVIEGSNYTTVQNITDQKKNIVDEIEVENSLYFSNFRTQAISYIAGYIIRSLIKKFFVIFV